MRDHRDLEVWRLGMDWVQRVYQLTKIWPSDERFGLTSQTRRAAVSIVANIAEGAARRGSREFVHHLSIARGSMAEADTLVRLSERLGYTAVDEAQAALNDLNRVGRMLSGLMNSLQRD